MNPMASQTVIPDSAGYANSSEKKWHVVAETRPVGDRRIHHFAGCGKRVSASGQRDATEIPTGRRCNNPGCKRLWI